MKRTTKLLFIITFLLVSYDAIVMHGMLGNPNGGVGVVVVKNLAFVTIGTVLTILYRKRAEEAELVEQAVCLGIILIYIYFILNSVSAFP